MPSGFTPSMRAKQKHIRSTHAHTRMGRKRKGKASVADPLAVAIAVVVSASNTVSDFLYLSPLAKAIIKTKNLNDFFLR